MVFLQFDRVYSSVIYLVIVLVFVINLVGCTLKILPVQLKKMKDYIPAKGKNNENLYENWMDIEAVSYTHLERSFGHT